MKRSTCWNSPNTAYMHVLEFAKHSIPACAGIRPAQHTCMFWNSQNSAYMHARKWPHRSLGANRGQFWAALSLERLFIKSALKYILTCISPDQGQSKESKSTCNCHNYCLPTMPRGAIVIAFIIWLICLSHVEYRLPQKWPFLYHPFRGDKCLLHN
jgi:hypothetical protein